MNLLFFIFTMLVEYILDNISGVIVPGILGALSEEQRKVFKDFIKTDGKITDVINYFGGEDVYTIEAGEYSFRLSYTDAKHIGSCALILADLKKGDERIFHM